MKLELTLKDQIAGWKMHYWEIVVCIYPPPSLVIFQFCFFTT